MLTFFCKNFKKRTQWLDYTFSNMFSISELKCIVIFVGQSRKLGVTVVIFFFVCFFVAKTLYCSREIFTGANPGLRIGITCHFLLVCK